MTENSIDGIDKSWQWVARCIQAKKPNSKITVINEKKFKVDETEFDLSKGMNNSLWKSMVNLLGIGTQEAFNLCSRGGSSLYVSKYGFVDGDGFIDEADMDRMLEVMKKVAKGLGKDADAELLKVIEEYLTATNFRIVDDEGAASKFMGSDNIKGNSNLYDSSEPANIKIKAKGLLNMMPEALRATAEKVIRNAAKAEDGANIESITLTNEQLKTFFITMSFLGGIEKPGELLTGAANIGKPASNSLNDFFKWMFTETKAKEMGLLSEEKAEGGTKEGEESSDAVKAKWEEKIKEGYQAERDGDLDKAIKSYQDAIPLAPDSNKKEETIGQWVKKRLEKENLTEAVSLLADNNSITAALKSTGTKRTENADNLIKLANIFNDIVTSQKDNLSPARKEEYGRLIYLAYTMAGMLNIEKFAEGIKYYSDLTKGISNITDESQAKLLLNKAQLIYQKGVVIYQLSQTDPKNKKKYENEALDLIKKDALPDFNRVKTYYEEQLKKVNSEIASAKGEISKVALLQPKAQEHAEQIKRLNEIISMLTAKKPSIQSLPEYREYKESVNDIVKNRPKNRNTNRPPSEKQKKVNDNQGDNVLMD